MPKQIISISGMHCKSCEILVEQNLKKIKGIENVKVNHKTGQTEINFKNQAPSLQDITQAVKDAGYDVGETAKLPFFSRDFVDYKNLLISILILSVGYLVAKWIGLLDLNINTNSDGIFISLIVGLVAGISTCMALVGGLVLALSARHAEVHPEATAIQKFRPHLFFNLGRIIGFGIFGGLIGLIGSTIKFSPNMLGILTVIIGIAMIFLGLKLIEIFPIFKNWSISFPKSVTKLFGFKREEKEYSHTKAMLTGALTFFLPCGFTQAMQLYAVSTGSFGRGALIMMLFALGTALGLLGVGGLSSIIKGRKARLFFAIAGLLVILFGVFNISNGSTLIFFINKNNLNVVVPSAKAQEVRMTQKATKYVPDVFTVKKGIPVKWIITSETTFSCASSIVMPEYGISQSLKKGENIITFTPRETGEIPFSCSMGMYTGKFIVVENSPSSSTSTSTVNRIKSNNNIAQASGCGGCGGCGGSISCSLQNNALATTSQTEQLVSNASVQNITATYNYRDDLVPNTFNVSVNQPVRLEIDVQENGYGCMSTITIPGLYDTVERLRQNQKIVMLFTPTKIGDYPITCAMGVPRGTIKVKS